MAVKELGKLRRSALLVSALVTGCATSPGGPTPAPDSGPRGDGVSFRDSGPRRDGAVVSPDAAAGIPPEQLGAEIQQAKCEGLLACGLAPAEATCLRAVTVWPRLAQLLADVAAGRVVYDPVQAAACLALYRGRDCPVLWFDVAARSAACRATFRGVVAVGGACFNDVACGSGRCARQSCAEGGRCCAGKCVENPLVPLGEDCSAGRCAEDAICFEQVLGPPLCDTRSVVGEDCWDHADCIEGLLCGGGFGTSTPGVCHAPASSGAACDATLGGAACGRVDEWCDAAEQKCKARVPVNGDCDPSQPSCVGMAWCGSDGRCALRPGPDEACDVFAAPCLGELTCDETCQLEAELPACP